MDVHLWCQDAVSLAREEEEPEAAAQKLTEVAFTRGSADNITCIVVRFHHDKAVASSPQQDWKQLLDGMCGSRNIE